MRLYSVTIKLYEELYRQTSLNNGYKLTPNKIDKKIIFGFIKWLKTKYHTAEVGAGLLIQYFEFQFSHYFGMKTKFHGKIMLNWIVGRKAIQRWEDRDLRFKWIVRVKVNSDVQLNLLNAFKEERKVVAISRKSKLILNLNDTEETSKKRFYNTLKGFVYCQMMTTLYNPKSELCEGCINRIDCLNTLREELPEFHKLRVK